MTATVGAGHRVVVVEDRAHLGYGHFPNLFAELADALATLGVEVIALTSRRWAFEGLAPTAFTRRRYRRWAAAVLRSTERLSEALPPWTRPLRLLNVVRSVLTVTETRHLIGRLGPGPVGVIVVSYGISTSLVCALAGPGRWVVHRFEPLSPAAGPVGRLLRSQVARGHGRAVLAVPEANWVPGLAYGRPELPAAVLAQSGTRPVPPLDGSARARLGLDPEVRVLLHFGASHGSRDANPVTAALARRDDWQLVIAGQLAANIDPSAYHGWSRPAVVLAGAVDQATRHDLWSAADAAVLSFAPGYRRNSGTLMDAISYAVPVVCSSRSLAGDVVEEFGLGTCFAPGDAASLSAALDRLDPERTRSPLAAAAAHFSNINIARAHLDWLTSTTPPEARGPNATHA
jgi:glycosyltransferase involved in cell wall biosynthesis